jgi:diadenosine tetraphosphate (Ap4A) HIT family hydrolase
MPESGFSLDPALEAVGLPLGDFPLSRVFLFDDARYPWLMLVPRRAEKREIIELDAADQAQLFSEITKAMGVLQSVTRPDKLNLGVLGNVTPQLHIHLVGRFVSDPAWPGPVWGHGERKPYPPHMVGVLMDKMAGALGFEA